jgi:hypothetical protein
MQTPMAGRPIIVGHLALTINLLRLGQLKQVRDELVLVRAMGTLSDVPSDAQIEAMITLVYVSASLTDAVLTRERVAQAFNDLPFSAGLVALCNAAGAVLDQSGVTATGDTEGSPGSPSVGEVASPADSISSGSTG